ncbi:uncharacterized protein LOC141711502 isoform X2 [Apium graveolens]|uniref:uncharacterized protein LOC141711502 isoform X2 n=1 Tax=Apium graveolens TaxID=4045 RepID=UPI003D799FC4
MCLQNWPTPAITWASIPLAHKNAVWAEFQKRYRWEDEQGDVISNLFWQKCAARMKDMIAKDRGKALHNAGIDYEDEDAMEHMHKYSPWWCTADIWEAMCNQWRDEKWLKKGKIASSNRAAGGEKAKGTYKGGSISQLQHIVVRESESQGPVNWVDVYVKTRDGIPEAVTIAELWDKAAKVKKNYVKGQGQRRRPSIYGSSFSTQSSSQPSIHTPADCVRAICRDLGLLRILGGHLGALDPEELARAVAEVNASQQRDDSEGAHRDDHDEEFGGSS